MSDVKDWQAMHVKCQRGGQMFRVERVPWEGSAPTFRGTCGCCQLDQTLTMKPLSAGAA